MIRRIDWLLWERIGDRIAAVALVLSAAYLLVRIVGGALFTP